ncbi:MAG TPA: PHB depolymerase family esterase [Burkholderiaceae bacterium]|nr:PHB depolymerase family esterase [Burkholderiaceae bacterium]
MIGRGLPGAVFEALRLTRAGRLLEATARIQRALHRAAGDAGAATRPVVPRTTADDAIDVPFVEVDENRPPRRTRPDAPSGPRIPERFEAGSYAHEQGARTYRLYVPADGDGRSLPLVVMLHGCTQTAEDFARGTRMNRLAARARCLVLYPEQAESANASRCWNWFRRDHQQRDHGEPAILAGMTREIATRHGVDSRRIYVVGLSAGGAMAAVLATLYPELYAAVGVHSGLAFRSAHDLPSALAAMRGMPSAAEPSAASPQGHATPTIVFHGDQDRTVHPRNGERVAAHAAAANAGAGEAFDDDVTVEHGEAPGGHRYTRTIHRDRDGHVLLEHWLVHGGGHAWFGGSREGSHADSRGPDASREMIRFFSECAVAEDAA